MQKRQFSASRVGRAAIWAVGVIVVCILLLQGTYALKRYWYWQHEQLTVRPKIAGVVYIKGKRTAGIELRAAMAEHTVPACASLPVIATSSSMGSFVASALRKPRFRVGRGQITLAICLTRGKTEVDSWVTTYQPGALPPLLLMCEFPIEEGARSKAHACFSTP
jgi:hypothetical protein